MTFEATVGRVHLQAEVMPMGQDLCIAVTGGDKAHLGCAALAVPHPGIRDATSPSATVSTINLTAHRDDVLANRIARQVCTRLKCPVAVCCGVHFDAFDAAAAQEAVEAAECLAGKIIAGISEGQEDGAAREIRENEGRRNVLLAADELP